MKCLITIVFLFCAVFLKAQNPNLVTGVQKQYTIAGRNVLVWTPTDTSTFKKYNLLLSFTGNGCNDSAGAVNQGHAKRIRTNTTGIHRDSFVVVTIIRQVGENSGVAPGSATDGVLDTLIKYNKFIDTLKCHMAGLSQGAQEAIWYLSSTYYNIIGYTPKHQNWFVTQTYNSPGGYTESFFNDFHITNTWISWGTADVVVPIFYIEAMYTLFNTTYGYASPKTKKIEISGAGHDATVWDSTTSLAGTTYANNNWIWMLQSPRGGWGGANTPPSANAGVDQVINLPTTTVSLSGSASTDVDLNIATYSWSKIEGPTSFTITTPSSVNTTVTGLVHGLYKFKLTVTDDSSAVDYDTVQVAVVPAYQARSRFYMVKEKPFYLGGPAASVNPEWLTDNDNATAYNAPSGSGLQCIQEVLYSPYNNLFLFDTAVTNFTMRMYVGYGTQTATFKFFNDALTDSATVYLPNTGVSTAYYTLDSFATRAIPFAIRGFEMLIPNCNVADFRELEFYGNTSNVTPVKYFPDTTYTSTATVEDFIALGINGDETATRLKKMVKHVIVGNVAFYNDTATVGITLGNHKFISNVFGDNVKQRYQTFKDSGLVTMMYTLGKSPANSNPVKLPYTGGGGGLFGYYTSGDYEGKNIPYGSDSTNPNNYKDHARMLAALTILYGANPSANDAGYDITVTGGASYSKGDNTLFGISSDNEADASWGNKDRYTSPQVQISKLSAVRDSIKAKDNTMLVLDGAMAVPHLQVIKAKGWYAYRYRGYKNYPADVETMNYYTTVNGGQGPGNYGISPEKGRDYEKYVEFRNTTTRYLGALPFYIQEFTWERGNSNYRAPVIAGSTKRKTAADFMLRAIMWGRAAGLDRMYWFRSTDGTRDQETNGDFALSGAMTGYNDVTDSAYKYWPVGYGLGWLRDISKKHKGRPTIIVNGDSTSYTIWKDTAVAGYDTVTYYVSMGTSNASTAGFTINAPVGKTFSYIQKIEPKFDNGNINDELGTGDFIGIRTTETPGASITGTAKERMTIYRVKEVSSGESSQRVRIKKFQRVRSI